MMGQQSCVRPELGGKYMHAERDKATQAPDPTDIDRVERRIRLLADLRRQSNLEADTYYQLAKIAESEGDLQAAKSYLEAAIVMKPGHVLAVAALSRFLDDRMGEPATAGR